MVDIDERVVQMKFDSSDFEEKSKSTFKILDTLKEKLSFKDATDSDNLKLITENVQKVADKAYTIVDRTIDKIKDNIANKLVKYLQENTIGQLSAGWEKYADMTTSVATLKAQGYSMKTITEQLERLNYFTDETSYSFTSMVSEIGKFTASGQKLEDATLAMMGIANWAALSGKNATDASRAMYQLSQALGAGKIRKEDWKSIQNLNMDTKEFRENAIEAAIAMGTLKESSAGVYTTLVGKKANKISFSINEFADKLTEGEWFTADVMMQVFGQYAEAVDEIHEMYLAENEEIPTAQIVKEVKESNAEIIEKFKDTQLSSKDINKLLNKWKKVEKVTDETVANYAAANDLSKEQARTIMSEEYAEYLKEYSEIFNTSEEQAKAALDDWKNYVSEFGLKAFLSAQEAKTFRDAIDSAKDAASSVWTSIYTSIFGDYEQAKELWTDLANALYEIFVSRLWSLAEIFDYWKDAGRSAAEDTLEAYIETYNELKEKANPTAYEINQMNILKKKIEELGDALENGTWESGRTIFMQGIYAFGMGLKSIIVNFRTAWDDTFENNQTAESLLSFSEKLRISAFKFYVFMKSLAESNFYDNIAAGIKNILAPLKAIVNIIKGTIGQFLPEADDARTMLVSLSAAFRKLTEKIVPSEETINKIARILRGFVATIKLIGKAIYGVYLTFIKPVLDVLFEVFGNLFDTITDILAGISDVIFEFEEGLGPLEAMRFVASSLGTVLRFLIDIFKSLANAGISILSPVFNLIGNSVKKAANKIRQFTGKNNGNVFKSLSDGFTNVAAKAKVAWTSTETLGDIFNRFRAGEGISNVIEMLGEMLDNLITRIGRTIVTIFGLEDVVNNGSIGKGVETIKDVIVKAFEIIKWTYTNVIRPVLSTIVTGLSKMFQQLGKSLKEGDLKTALTTIKEIVSTLTSVQIFKLINVITKTFGSGGILKVLRNFAKAEKGLYIKWGGEGMNAMAGAIIKVAIAMSILAGAAAALSFLPTENLERMNKMMISFVITFAIFAGVLITLTALADNATWGFLTLGFAFASITAMVFAFIGAARLLSEYMDKLFGGVKDEKGNLDGWKIAQGLIVTLGPFVTVMALLLILMKMFKKLSMNGNVLSFGLGFIGLLNGVSSMINAFDHLLKIIHDPNNTLQDLIVAMGLIFGMFAMLGLTMKLISKSIGFDLDFKKSVGSGVASAIAIAAFALVIRLVLIPTLDTLVENKDKFKDYLGAFAVLAACMLGIGWTMKMIVTGGSFLAILAAAYAFRMMTVTLRDSVIPLIQEFSRLGSDTIHAIALISLISLALAKAIQWILIGVSRIVTSMSLFNPAGFARMILSVGLVVLGIMALAHIFHTYKEDLSIDSILVVVGLVIAILAMISLFVIAVTKYMGSNIASAPFIAQIFFYTALIITVITAGLLGTMLVITALYGDKWREAIDMLIWIAGIISGTLVITLVGVGAAILIMGLQMKNILSEIGNRTIAKIVIATFIAIASILVALTLSLAILRNVYKGDSEALWEDTKSMLFGVIGSVAGTLLAISLLIKVMGNENSIIAKKDIAAISITLGSVIAILLIIAFGLIPAIKTLDNISWEPIIAIFGGVALVLLSVLGMAALLTKVSNNPDVFANVIGSLVVALVSLIVIMKGLPDVLNAFNAIKGINTQEFIMGLALMIGPLLTLITLVKLLSDNKAIGVKFLETAAYIAGGILLIAAAISALAVAFTLWQEVANPGSTWLTNGLFITKGLSKGIDTGAKDVNESIEDLGDGMNKTFTKKEQEKSPSKLYKKYGKYIDQGLAMGIEQNQQMAYNATEGMAMLADEGLCETLGIASPSKVFYENGRFVVRGFLNGVNDESNKNKQAGIDMAAGFSEGMQDVMDEWAGLWSDFGADIDITEGAKKFGEDAANGIFAGLFGEETFEKLTDEEEKRLKELQNNRDEALKQWEKENKDLKISNPRLYEEKKSQFLNTYSDELNELLARKTRAGQKKTTSKMEGSFIDMITGAITGATESSSVLDSITGLGTTIGGGILSFFSEGGGGKDFIDSAGAKICGFLGIKMEEGGDDAGTQLGNSVSNGLIDGITSRKGELTNMASDLASDMGSAFYDGLTGWVSKALDYLSGATRKSDTRKYNNALLTSLADHYGLDKDNDRFVALMNLAFSQNPDIILSAQELADIYKKYNEALEVGQVVNRIDLDESLLDLYHLDSFKLHTDQGIITDETEFTYAAKTRFAQELKRWDNSINLYGQELTNAYNAAVAKGIIDNDGYLILKNMYGQTTTSGSMSVDAFNYAKNNVKQSDLETFITAIKTGVYYGKNNFSWEEDELTLLERIANAVEENNIGKLNDYKDSALERYDELVKNIANADQQTRNSQKYKNWVAEKEYYEQVYGWGSSGSTYKKTQQAINTTNEITKDLASEISDRYEELNKNINNADQQTRNSDKYKNWLSEKDYYENIITNNSGQLDNQIYRWFKNYKGYELSGEEITTAFYTGLEKGWLVNEGGIIKLGNREFSEFIKEIESLLQIKSPSRVAIGIMKFFMQGLGIGIEDNTEPVLNIIGDSTNLMTDQFKIGLNAISDMLDTEVTPTLTPIFDGTNIRAGITTALNSAVSVINPKIDATASSFQMDTPNYNGSFATLANQVNGLTGVVNSFMQMVAEGDIVTVNVNAEADPNNIYNYVIDANRQRFRQTGKNPLAY